MGEQPTNFDDFSAIYNRYRVWGSKFHWKMANNASGALDPATAVIGPRHLSTAITALDVQNDFATQPYTKVQKTTIYQNGTKNQNGTLSMSTQKFLGLKRTEFEGNDDLTAIVTTSPVHRWFWHLTVSADDGSSTIGHYIHIMVDYDVEFWDRVDTAVDLMTRLVRNKAAKKLRDFKDSKDSKSPIAVSQTDSKELDPSQLEALGYIYVTDPEQSGSRRGHYFKPPSLNARLSDEEEAKLNRAIWESSRVRPRTLDPSK